jgi:hypothetical protein
VTAFALKIIALGAMLADHLAVVFPGTFPFWFRGIGRLAWPIFAYLLAEGFRHTKSPGKFLMRLFVFALVSEIPYDIAMGSNICFFADTNIFYTLTLGGIAIFLYEKRKNQCGRQTMAFLAAILPTAILAEILSTEYGGMGVLFIYTMHAVTSKPLRLTALGAFALAQFIPLAAAYSLGIEVKAEYLMTIPFALAVIPLIAMYNGERGIKAKWLFYFTYPAHLALFAAIAAMINGLPQIQ